MSAKARPVILAVDDAADLLALMAKALSEYHVLTAEDAGAAIAAAEGEPRPDLILLDVEMPGVSGFEVCRALKSEPRTADIPVIFLTGKTEAKAQVEGLELGAVDYITKPVSPPIVLARVKAHLRIKAVADFLRDHNEFLKQELALRGRDKPELAKSVLTIAREFKS